MMSHRYRHMTCSILVLSLLLESVQARRRLPTTTTSPFLHNNNETTTSSNRHLGSSSASSISIPTPSSPDEHLVTSLPLLDPADFSTRHWAGLLPASTDKTKYFFYWLFAPAQDAHTEVEDNDDTDIPLIIWLNGGPACSSMDGLFLENGPFRFQVDSETSEWKLVPAEYSWHKVPAYTLYIDQPVGTGLSVTTTKRNYPSNDAQVNQDFYAFLQAFFALHADTFVSDDKQAVRRPVYFSGESHAGHYIPSMMHYILQQNDQNTNGIKIPLAGAAIGNGWTDPRYQYSAHEAAYGVGLIGLAQRNFLQLQEEKCQADLAARKYSSKTCFGLLDYVTKNGQGSNAPYKVSSYDNRNWERVGQSRDFPHWHDVVETYLGGHALSPPNKYGATMSRTLYKEVLQAIHASASRSLGQVYQECTDPPYEALAHQDGLGVVPDVQAVLAANANTVRLLFFNGIHDLICNHVGNEEWISRMEWEHQDEWNAAKRYGWKSSSSGELAGYAKGFANLMYLKVLNSGHMVPMDVPDVALDMMREFVNNNGNGSGGLPFSTYKQAIGAAPESKPSCPACPKDNVCPACPSCPYPANEGDQDDDDESEYEDDEDDKKESHYSSPALRLGPLAISQGVTWLLLITCFAWTLYSCWRERRYHHEYAKADQNGSVELQSSSAVNGYRDEVDDEYGDTSAFT